jgi:hypothetical protein
VFTGRSVPPSRETEDINSRSGAGDAERGALCRNSCMTEPRAQDGSAWARPDVPLCSLHDAVFLEWDSFAYRNPPSR